MSTTTLLATGTSSGLGDQDSVPPGRTQPSGRKHLSGKAALIAMIGAMTRVGALVGWTAHRIVAGTSPTLSTTLTKDHPAPTGNLELLA
jgi:hypothetical protein